jgi:CTP synthase (UTP-ammonia lyase)
MIRIALIGEFDPSFPPHMATVAACVHSAATLGIAVDAPWISTRDIAVDDVREFSALWITPGSPYKSLANTLAVIRYAREHRVPCFGTCGGFQHLILEYARNVLGFRDAQHAEYDPYASDLFVTQLECSLVGRELRIILAPGSRVAEIYGDTEAHEQYYCNFGINPDKSDFLRSGDLRITGSDAEGEVRVIELPAHPFFIGTLFVPQLRSSRESPHPLVTAFMRAAAGDTNLRTREGTVISRSLAT